ncbi:APC family permease [Amycolatopsis lurida]
MSEKVSPGAAPGTSVPEGAGGLKSGAVGTPHIIAMVVAAAAPITCTVSILPLGFLLGNGIGTPGAILVVTVLLALFAVGFLCILPFIKNTGAFYAYVTAGFGRPAGLASAYMLVLAYVALGASVIGGFGYFANNLVKRYFHLDIPWAAAGIVGVALATALAALGVKVAGRVLLVILAIEMAAIVVLDAAVLFHNGLGSFSFDVFKPSNVFSGSIGIAGIYAFVLFLGFEATAIYTEEAKVPERTVPRATYWVIGLVGVFHILSSWSMVAGGGVDELVPRIAENPPLFTFGLSDQYVGSGWTDLIMIFNLLSLFAGIMAFQNAAARYLYALSRDRVLLRHLGRTHPRRGTPVMALTLVGVVYVIVTIIYHAARLDPVLELGASLIGLGTIGLLVMLSIASASIAMFFYRRGELAVAKVAAPTISACLLVGCAVAAILNYGTITGVDTWWVNNLPWIYIPVVLVGLCYGIWLRRNRVDRYAKIGKTRL